MGLPQRVRLVEVGPRDGLQNERDPLPTATRVEPIARLEDCDEETFDRNVRVNAPCPAYKRTPILEELNTSAGTLDDMAPAIPMRRLGRPEEIVQAIALDGGLTAG